MNVMIEPTIQLPSLASWCTTIDSFSNSECWNFFETRKEDMYRLKVRRQMHSGEWISVIR
jgi:hypothetical protein